MPRTLFNVMNEEVFTEESVSDLSKYTWLPQFQVLPIGDWRVLVNPDNGGWVAFDKNEFRMVKTDSKPPQSHVGEFLYQAGLCARDGYAKKFVQNSDYTEQLYFFEFAVTTGCNLACIYCFADARPAPLGGTATIELAELFIDRIAEYRANARTNIPFIIEFTGGEPLLNFKVIRHTVDYAERTYGDLLNARYVIQSNLTLLTNEIIEYIKQHNIGLGVSCDGFDAVHDKQRPFMNGRGSHQVVETNMMKLHGLNPDNSGGVITVITQESVNKMPEIFLYLYLCGCREMILRPKEAIGRGAMNPHKASLAHLYVEGLFNVLSSVITPLYYQRGELIKERYLSLTFQHLFHPYRAFMCERSPCGAARNICIVQPNGDVYSCNQSADDTKFLLGSIIRTPFKDILKSDIAQMLGNRTVDKIDECRVCTFRSWCSSPCPLVAFRKYGSMMAKSADCDLFMYRYERALRGLLENEFDLPVVGKLAGFDVPIHWFEV